MKYITSGTTSVIYRIDDKIIKIGKPRSDKTIPYNEFLLHPIINTDCEFDGFPIHIEVTEAVNTVSIEEKTLYKKYVNYVTNKLKDMGLDGRDLNVHNIDV